MEKEFNLEIAKILCNKNFNKNNNKNNCLKSCHDLDPGDTSNPQNSSSSNMGERHILILDERAVNEFREHLKLLRKVGKFVPPGQDSASSGCEEAGCLATCCVRPELPPNRSSSASNAHKHKHHHHHHHHHGHKRHRSLDSTAQTLQAVQAVLRHHDGPSGTMSPVRTDDQVVPATEPNDVFQMSPVFFPFVDSTLMYVLDRLFSVALRFLGKH